MASKSPYIRTFCSLFLHGFLPTTPQALLRVTCECQHHHLSLTLFPFTLPKSHSSGT